MVERRNVAATPAAALDPAVPLDLATLLGVRLGRPVDSHGCPTGSERWAVHRDAPISGGFAQQVVGRERDVERIAAFLADPGAGGALRVTGGAGVGKTVVLDFVAGLTEREGGQVLRAGGTEFEADVSYSALNQALLPFRGTLRRLERTYRDAIRVALGFGPGSPPERLVLSNAVLALLETVAADAPVLLVVDDLHWVDRASAAVLGFVARRLTGTGVRFLAAARTGNGGFFPSGGLPEYELPPLDEESSSRLVDLRFPALAGGVRRRLLDAAQGNPLALLELPKALRADQRTALEVLPTVLPLGQRLQSLFVSRFRGLPAATRDLLLLATLEGTGDLGALQASARAMGLDTDLGDLAPAEDDQLVVVDAATRRLVFRHPLISSAAVEASTTTRRRAAHRALADVLEDRPESRAWHLGEATLRPDEQVAALLEQAARRILRRGDAVAAIAALTRAADLSPLGADRARRLAEAAYIGAEATGALLSARGLLEDARRADPNHAGSLHSAAAAVQVLLNSDGDVCTAHRLLVGAIEEAGDEYDSEDPALIDALHLLLLLSNFGAREELWAPFRAVLSRLRPEPPALLAVAGQMFSDPARTSPATLRQLDVLLDGAIHETDPAQIVRLGTAAIYADRLADLREPSWRLVHQGRDGGPIRRHLGGLMHLCLDDYHRGRWDEAVELSEEGLALCGKSGYTFFTWYFQFTMGLTVASRGDADTAHALADQMLDWASPRGVRAAVQHAHHVRAIAHIATGAFDEAFREAAAVSPAGPLAPYEHQAVWAFFDLVESAVRTDRRAQAADHVRALRASNVSGLSPRLAMLTAASEALVTEDDARAIQIFDQALRTPDAHRWSFDAARVQLAMGERLRRVRATSDSKEPLKSALRCFQRLGSRAWAERATKELRAAGLHVPGTEGRGTSELTPQEREIAQLAASGLTNKQIAERLFISHRTVGAHLYQIYPKLGITSRIALRDTLA